MFDSAAHRLQQTETDWPRRVGFSLLAGSIALSQVSIAASQILLVAAITAAFVQKKKPAIPWAVLWPLLALVVWTVTAVLAASGSPRDALVRKFFLYSILFLVPLQAASAKAVSWIYHAVFAVAAFSGGAGLIQFVADPNRSLVDRISGFLSIWMTFSGSLMLAMVALTAFALFEGWRRHLWVIPVAAIIAAALYLSQTRSAWGGTVAGMALILILKRPRSLLVLIAILVALFLASPAGIRQRLISGWNPEDTTTKQRIEVFGSAVRMIRDHPWLGVGQRVSREILAYRNSTEYPDYAYIHMHNNFLQIAAERGIPGLLLWIWFMAQLGWQALKGYRTSGSDPTAGFVCAAALGGWVALMSAGMLEYNFGDSEVLTLFLFIISGPLALLPARQQPDSFPPVI